MNTIISKYLILLALVGMVVQLFIFTNVRASSADDSTEVLGTIEMLPNGSLIGDWKVSGRSIRVSSTTVINQERGIVVIGAMVEVKGSSNSDGSISATTIEVKSSPGNNSFINFQGTIESLPANGLVGDWTVSGQIVRVSTSTVIKQENGSAVVGARVEIQGFSQPDKSITADKIEIKARGNNGNETEFHGILESIPLGFIGNWQVSGKTVFVTSSTVIKKRKLMTIGSRLQIKGRLLSDGTIQAKMIKLDN